MKPISVVERLSEMVQDEVAALSSNVMLKVGDQYQLFDTYTIVRNHNGSCTTIKKQRDPRCFSRIQSAVAWCIADKLQRYDVLRSLEDLDHRCATIKTDLAVSGHLLKQMSNTEQKQVVSAKVASKQDTLRSLENQLTKMINLTKYWQIKGFIRDETARPRKSKNTR
jgi:hypothetical protein